jgi:hypothetical protein
MTTRITRSKPSLAEAKKQSPKLLSALSKKTDVNARKKINLEPLASPTTKRAHNTAFPLSPSSPLSSPSKRLSKIVFPDSPALSPRSSPERMPQPVPLFAEHKPQHMRSLFDTDFSDFFSIEENLPFQTPNKKAKESYGLSEFLRSDETRTDHTFDSFAIPSKMTLPTAGLFANSSTTNSISIEENRPSLTSWRNLTQTTGAKLPPPTPVKKARAGSFTSLVVSLFKKLHETLITNTFKYKVTYLAKGSYSNVYTLENNEDPIIPGVNNSDLVLKAFHGEKSGFNEKTLSTCLRNEIENYRAVSAAGLPVAMIYNADTAEQDGYIIQEKISGKIDPLNAQHMLQVRRFFDISVKENLLMDLLAQNLALKNEEVILFDFVEEPDEGFLFHKQAIQTWLKAYREAGGAKDKAAAFLNGLSADHYQEFVQEQLNRFS